MSNAVEKICRLCLKTICSNDFDIIEDVTLQMFAGLFLKLEITKNKENLMCSKCAFDLQKSFDFKLACISLKHKDLLFGKGSLKVNSSKSCSIGNGGDAFYDRNVCRFCARLTEAESSTCLNETKQNMPIIKMLQQHIPELELNISEELVSCERCFKSIQHLLSFTATCSYVEQKVKGYNRTQVTDDKSKIKLEGTEHLAPPKHVDNNVVYKIEEVFVKIEGGSTIKTEMKDENMEIDNLVTSCEGEGMGTKSKQSNNDSTDRLSSWIGEYEEELSILSDTEIMCDICSKVIQVTRRHHIVQHVEGKTHLRKLSSQPRDTFNEELCETLLAANIPLQKIDNPVLKQFLDKHTCRAIPAASTLRKYCVGNIYNKIMDTIRKNISNNYLWISADETTDHLGRCVVNVVVGSLLPHSPSDSYLVATKIIETVTAENVAMVINSALGDLCINNDESCSKVLLFLTDAAAYMLRTGELLKTNYPYLLHVTCTARALHRICEFIGSKFKCVDTLISTFKKNFLKTPSRVALYKNICPLPLPPQPVATRWGTWIEAALFYSKHLEKLKEVFNSVDDNVQPIVECRNIIQKLNLYQDLKYIDNNFSCLPEHIEYLETPNIPLEERISKFGSIITHLKNLPNKFGRLLKQKVEAIYAENPDISVLHLICTENFENRQTQMKYQHLIPYFKYAPVTSCHVEKTFSRFKDVASPKRLSFTETNLERHLIINANSKILWNVDDEEL